MADIAHVVAGTTILASRENASTDELNNSVKRSGNETRTGSLNNNGPLQRSGQNVLTDARLSAGNGSALSGAILCTQAQFNAQTRYNDILYIIVG